MQASVRIDGRRELHRRLMAQRPFVASADICNGSSAGLAFARVSGACSLPT
jgi:hypothetical protein